MPRLVTQPGLVGWTGTSAPALPPPPRTPFSCYRFGHPNRSRGGEGSPHMHRPVSLKLVQEQDVNIERNGTRTLLESSLKDREGRLRDDARTRARLCGHG